jgi:hypothetical protein
MLRKVNNRYMFFKVPLYFDKNVGSTRRANYLHLSGIVHTIIEEISLIEKGRGGNIVIL